MENCLSYPLEGKDSAHSFANSFCFTILRRDWNKMPTDMELRNDEFEEFCKCDNPMLYKFPHLYNFVKTHIYFIIIHQQQVERFFNKLDLNISLSLKQSKLQLASGKILKEDLTLDLKEIHT
ncbi:unnamed protein product [Rhizophagus irregularis]|nr:unnamed protein product [Rhizophagus irregularis]